MIGNPALEIFLISAASVVVQNLIFKRLSDQAALRELKKDIDHHMKEMKEAQKAKELEKLEKVMSKLNSLQMKRLQLTMKPNLLSSFVFIALIGWVKVNYANLIVQLPVPIPGPIAQPPFIVLTPTLGWFGWYFVCVILASLVVRELLEIEI